MSKKERFTELLKLIFQFHKDQIDLDFGVYRVFKHKESELVSFISDKLPKFIEECVASNKTEIDDAYNDVLEFFGRYYKEGDFYPVPRLGNKKAHILRHNGEEVIFSWANKEQYYIKSLDSFSTYRIVNDNLFPDDLFDKSQGKCVLFQIANVDDIKGDQKKARYYVLNESECFHGEDGFHVMLDYKVMSNADAKNQEITPESLHAFLAGKQINIGLDDVEYHLDKFKRLRKSDFFIHKNLKKFLSEELDYYLKSEIIRLDGNDYHLRRAIVAKEVGAYIIEFLARLEDLQKQLWEKKKFIYDCHYVISLNKLAEYAGSDFVDDHAGDILDSQKAEWTELGLGDYSSIGELKDKDDNYLPLPLDTKNFDQEFKWQLLEAISSDTELDDVLDGLCVHSDNWQALNVLQNKYHRKVKCIYIDPPYNTQEDRVKGRFAYKDTFEHSSWLSMMASRIDLSLNLMANECAHFISLDENELARQMLLLSDFNELDTHGILTWRRTRTGGHLSKSFNQLSDYVIVSEKKSTEMRLYGGQADPEEDQPLYKTTNKNKTLCFPIGSIYFKDFADGMIGAGMYGNGSTYKVKSDIQVSEHYNQTSVEIEGPFVWTQTNMENEIKDGASFIVKKHDNMNIRFFRRPKGHKPLPSLADNNFVVGTNEDASSTIRNLFGKEESKEIEGTPKPTQLISKLIKTKSFFDPSLCVLDYFAGSGSTAHSVIEANQDGSRVKFILVESQAHFQTVLLPRLKKVSFTLEWNDGTPLGHNGKGIFFKYHSLEQYEDSLENITLQPETGIDLNQQVTKANALKPFGKVYEDAMLSILPHVALENAKPLLLVENELLNRPFDFTMRINIDGSVVDKQMDLIETFNTLLGIHVQSFKSREFEGNRYVFVDSADAAIIWREFESEQINDDFIKREREFIEQHISLDGKKTFYMNGINQGYADKQLPAGAKETLYKLRELLLEGTTR